MPNPSPIQCSKCSAGNSAESLDCSKCGGRVVRICGACGFKNSAAKGFCDVCGEEMTAGTAGQVVPKHKVDATPDEIKKKAPQPAPPPPTPEPVPTPEPDPPPKLPPIGKQPEPEAPTTPTPAKPNPRRSLEDFLPRTGVQRIIRDKEPQKEKTKDPLLNLKTPEPKPLENEPPKTIIRQIAEKKPPADANRVQKKEEAPPRAEKKFEPKREQKPQRHKPVSMAKDDLAFTQRTIRRVKERPIASTVTVILLLAVSAGIYGILWKQRNTPSRVLMKAAGNYLFSLKEKNFGAAYNSLSNASKAALSSDQFATLQEKGDWSFDNLEIKSLTGKWGFITYKLFGTNTSGDDWLHFVLENRKWKRAYWWHHMETIENALAKRDFKTALQTANEAAKINPRDPLVNSYLCEAAYGLERWETAVKVCKRTFAAASKFRSRLGPKDLFHLHTLMGDIYRHHLGKPDAALLEYNIMLAFPLLDADSRCDILLARGDTFLIGRNFSKALPDYQEATKHCRNIHDQAFAERNAKVLSGEAATEAVERLMGHTMPGDTDTLFEWRMKVRESLARELKTAVEDLAVKEGWTAQQLQGPTYKVMVTDRSTPILTGEVDLLGHSVKVNIHVQ